jgi:hypothetical protein
MFMAKSHRHRLEKPVRSQRRIGKALSSSEKTKVLWGKLNSKNRKQPHCGLHRSRELTRTKTQPHSHTRPGPVVQV